MLDNLEPTVRIAILRILSALYESGMVEEVALGDVLRLFGVPDNFPGDKTTGFLFDDPDWITEYLAFKDAERERVRQYDEGLDELDELDELVDSDDFADSSDLDSDRKIH